MKACEKTEWKEAHIISTLAAGYAETADWENAKKFAKQAVEVGKDDGDVADQLAAELESYEQGKPWRERQTIDDAAVQKAPAAANGIAPRRPFIDE
jgi:hypothetical protein